VLHGCEPGWLLCNELTLPDVEKLLDDAISVKPRRQMTVQLSGGEPTISPIFLDAARYARKVGYFSAVQAATNGIRFAQDADFCAPGAEASEHAHRHQQFDGVSEERGQRRTASMPGNRFDVVPR
jgi:uncharacterized radical SAM superfamily Fe-S cluster-containing enzyme